MQIPLYNLLGKEEEIEKIKDAVVQVIESGQYIFGEEVSKFEAKWAQYSGYKYAVGVNSGTHALEAIIRSYPFSKNSRIIVPVNTYSATAMAVCNAGCTPVFVDCNEKYGMDLEGVENIIDNEPGWSKIWGIIPVHLYGIPEDLPNINAIAKKYELKVIEDAAQSHGIGLCGNDRAYSFYPNKNLGAIGDAGIVVTNSRERSLWIESWRNQGRVTGNTTNHEIIGTNSRLDAVQAAVLNVKLDYLNDWNRSRFESAQIYFEELKDVQGIVLPPRNSFFHLFVIRINDGKRDSVRKTLVESGIGCSVHYPIPLHLQRAYRHLNYRKGDFPIAEKLSSEILSLPMHPYLGDDEIKTVCSCVKKLLG